MRILYFSYAYPNAAAPNLGSFNRSLLAALAQDHDVRVVAPVSFVESLRGRLRGPSPFDPAYTAIPGVTANYLPFYYPPKLFRERYGDFLWWSVQKRLAQFIQEFRPDVILSYWAHPDGDVAVRAGRKFGIPVVTMVGGSDVLLLARQGRRRDAILNVLHQADAVVAVGQHLADTLIQDGLPADRLHVVRRGVDRGVFCPGDRVEARRELGLKLQRFTMVSVGRLVSVKGHTHLVRACAELHREGHSLACYVLGNGPLEDSLNRDIRSFGLEGTVHLQGPKPQAELAKWYRAADVTVLPSLSEGVPNVLLESIACGTPFIASDVGGIPEIADARLDTLIPKDDPSALAEAIRRRLAGTTNDMAGSSRRFASGAWQDSANDLCGVFAAIGVPVAPGGMSRSTLNSEPRLTAVSAACGET